MLENILAKLNLYHNICLKGALSSLNFWQLTESPLILTTETDEKCFLFYLKSLFRSRDISTFFRLFGHLGKGLDKKVDVNFKIYDVTDCITSN